MLGFDKLGSGARRRGNCGKAFGIRAVSAADYDHGIHPAGKRFSLGLALIGCRADGLFYHDLAARVTGPDSRGDAVEERTVEGGLRHETDLFGIGQRVDVLGRMDQATRSPGIAKEADDLGMSFIPGNDDLKSLIPVALDHPMHGFDFRAGTVDDRMPAVGISLLHAGRDTVGPNEKRTVLIPRIVVAELRHAAFLQHIERLAVMDERPDRAYPFRQSAGIFEREIHGALDAHAETRGFSDNDFHGNATVCFTFRNIRYQRIEGRSSAQFTPWFRSLSCRRMGKTVEYRIALPARPSSLQKNRTLASPRTDF